MGYIYQITNKINKKIYIGLTTKTIEGRWKEHIKVAFNPASKDYNTLFKKAIRKYGEKNFIIEELEQVDDLELLKLREQYWIKEKHSFAFAEDGWGYNSTLGGDGVIGYGIAVVGCDIITGEIYNIYDTIKEAEKQEGIRIEGGIETYNHSANQKCFLYKTTVDKLTDQERIDYIHSLYPTLIYCLSKKGEVIKIYLTAQEAAKDNNLSFGNIISCCLGKRRLCGDYQWAYQRDIAQRLNQPVKEIRKFSRPIIQYGMNGDKITEWDSIEEASKQLKISNSHITSCCRLSRNSAGGYQWRYLQNNIEKLSPITVKRPVKCVETQQIFDTSNDAAKHFKYSCATVRKSCDGNYINKPYHFEWVD